MRAESHRGIDRQEAETQDWGLVAQHEEWIEALDRERGTQISFSAGRKDGVLASPWGAAVSLPPVPPFALLGVLMASPSCAVRIFSSYPGSSSYCLFPV